MRAYIIRRVLLLIPTLLLVTIVVFFVIRLIPGDAVQLMTGEIAWMTGQSQEAIRHEMGLDVPAHVQYVRWIGNIVLHGDFGNSLWTRLPVLETVLNKVPVSFELGLLALFFSQIMAVPIGIFSAIRQETVGDYSGRSWAIFCISVPTFWLGTLVVIFPSIWWGWSPPIEYVSIIKNPIENLKMFIIPAFILGMAMSGITMRMMRTMMLEVLRQDYIRTAWAKGLKERVVVMRHALKNALMPVVTVVGVQVPVLIGGSVILENIFALPGIGRLLFQVILNRDYTVLSGINVMVASAILIMNLVVDITYAYLDPRIKYK